MRLLLWRGDCIERCVTLCRFVLLIIGMSGMALRGQAVPSAPPVGAAQTSNAASAPVSGPALSVSDAVAMALQNNPLLQGASATIQRTVAAAQSARAYSNPSVELYEGRQYARPIATPGVPGLLQHYAGYQTIEIPTERRSRLRAAQFAVAGSEAARQAVGLSVVAEVKHAFYDALRRREEIAHARENLQLVEDLRRRVEVEVQVGEKGRLELTRAEAELARARFDVSSAQIEYANAIALLRVAIAAPADAELNPQGDLEPRAALPPVKELREQVLRGHPIVAQSQAAIQAGQATLDHERTLVIPRPVAFAEFENQPDLRYWRVGFSVPIPLWDRRQGPIGEAKAAISESNAILGQRRLELISALERAYGQYQLADDQVKSLESGSLRAAESAVDAARAAYRFGERGIVELLDAQRVLQSVRGDLLTHSLPANRLWLTLKNLAQSRLE